MNNRRFGWIACGLGAALFASALGLAFWILQPEPEPPAAAPLGRLAPDEVRDQAGSRFDLFWPVPDQRVNSTFVPNLRGQRGWQTQVELRTNASGLRDHRELERKRDGVFRVVLLGDSFVAAAAAPYEDGVAAQLETMLRSAVADGASLGEIEVRPVAVGGWNLMSEIAFLEHNLHQIEPDLVVHVLGYNDLDSSHGFILGNVRSATYDSQGIFGDTHASVASPRQVSNHGRVPRGLIGSYLIPESVRRYALAGAEIDRLRKLLAEYYDAPYVMYLLNEPLVFGFGEVLGQKFVESEVAVAPFDVGQHTLRPLNGHPNREGHRYMALGVARFLADRELLPLDTAKLEEFGPYGPYAAGESFTREQAEKAFGVDGIPAAVELRGRRLVAKDQARTIVGGVYRGGILSPHAILALARGPDATRLTLEVRYPEHPNLSDGTTTVLVDGRKVAEIQMGGRPGEVVTTAVPLPPPASSTPLVEVTLESDRFVTEPTHDAVDGLTGYAPRAGTLVRAAID
ncbi:MAG: SGNH/GDSL hydrolase family protein [Candidatus Binatia bacterium]|nr:SGNH/GDSL hydrolase family protein [Candidatus Binatia bacterium]